MGQSNTRPELKVHTHTSGSAFKNVWCKLKAAPSILMKYMYLGIVKQRCHDMQRYVDRLGSEDREGSIPTQSTWKYHIILTTPTNQPQRVPAARGRICTIRRICKSCVLDARKTFLHLIIIVAGLAAHKTKVNSI